MDVTEDQVRARLEALGQEFERGQAMLRDVEAQRAQLGETLLRISGAMRVLRELLGEAQVDEPAANGIPAVGGVPSV